MNAKWALSFELGSIQKWIYQSEMGLNYLIHSFLESTILEQSFSSGAAKQKEAHYTWKLVCVKTLKPAYSYINYVGRTFEEILSI